MRAGGKSLDRNVELQDKTVATFNEKDVALYNGSSQQVNVPPIERLESISRKCNN